MRKRLHDDEAKELYYFLKDNPYASYDEMEGLFVDRENRPKINSLLIKLKRSNSITMIRQRNLNGQQAPSYKKCLKDPDW